MKIKDIKKHSNEFNSLAREVGEHLKSLPKRPVSKVQCASMQAIIDRDPAKDAEHWNRKLDLSIAIAKHPSEVERKMTPEEIFLVEDTRRKSKNTIGKIKVESSVSKEKKERAVEAFRYTPPTPIHPSEIDRLTRLIPIEELKSVPEKEKLSLMAKFKKLLKAESQSAFDKMSKEEQDAWSKIVKEKK